MLEPSIARVDDAAWNKCAGQHPFVRYEFLSALESSGALGSISGVIPKYALLYDTCNQLIACAPAMLKWGTLREYGPERNWLKAGEEQGLFKWPKFQLGVPFFPMQGPRILIWNEVPKREIQNFFLQALIKLWSENSDFAAFNVMHTDLGTAEWCQELGGVVTREWNAIWINKDFRSVDQFLLTIPMRKRYEFRRCRRQAIQHGLQYRVVTGVDLTAEMIADYYEGHRHVCARHNWAPWLPKAAYELIVQSIPDSLYLLGYFDQNKLVAGILVVIDHQYRTAYLLQWSEMDKLEGIALDLICYRPIEFGIEYQIQVVDSGLIAKHKTLRGWSPSPSYNIHWFRTESLGRLAAEHS